MSMTRRTAMKVLAAALPVVGGIAPGSGSLPAAERQGGGRTPGRTIANGPFKPTWESLVGQYRCPEWFRDAKFGIWAHWSAQCVPEQGDWYARHMYIQGDAKYDFHVRTYGHPSKVGFMEIDHLWKAERWEPEQLMDALQARRREVLRGARQPPRQLRRLRLEAPRVELGERRPEEGHRRRRGPSSPAPAACGSA